MKRWLTAGLMAGALLAGSAVEASASSEWVEGSYQNGQYVQITDGVNHVGFAVADLDQIYTSLWLPYKPVIVLQDTNGNCLSPGSYVLVPQGDFENPVCALPVWSH